MSFREVLHGNELPFAAVVGHTLAKRALLLLAIEPRLGGVMIAARPGTAKTTLARSFHALLPDLIAIKSCAAHCDPDKPADWCSDCRQRVIVEAERIAPPFVNLPLNVTEDRLLGGLALEATLQTGQRVAEHGLLTEANRGVLYADELNLLDDGAANYLMDALSRGRLQLEREGLSGDYPTNFIFMGTYNPDEGEIRGGLTDRVGLIVSLLATSEVEERAEIMIRAVAFDRDPTAVREAFEDETTALREIISQGRANLPKVTISDEQRRTLSEIAVRLGIVGNRADYFAVRAALASAALEGRTSPDDTDMKTALQLVLLPRATQLPEPPPDDNDEPPPPPPEPPEQNEQDDNEPEPPEPPEQPPLPEDLILAALDTEMPGDILALLEARQARAKSSGSRGEALNWKRGRHVQSVPGKPGQGRLALIATLRAAAPFQAMRHAEQPDRPGVIIKADDLRLKKYKDKAGVLFIFIVDASGSMALNRMREAKGAVTQLLQQAYIHRDKVALIAFRGRAAEVLLPPSQGVELAKRSLDVLPTGGGTPLASAMLEALQMSDNAKRQGITKTMLVLITDGRGNILLNEDEATASLARDARKQQAAAEIEKLAAGIAASGMFSVVLDTQSSFVSKGEAAQLARQLGGEYIYLPRADARAIAGSVSGAADNLR